MEYKTILSTFLLEICTVKIWTQGIAMNGMIHNQKLVSKSKI
jgi:hypothetical protein